MAITADDERLIRRFLGINKIGTIESTVGRIIPGRVYFEGVPDYWATIDSVAYSTQYDVEVQHIKFCSFYYKGFRDVEGPVDSPLVSLTYEVYVFSQYDVERSDENISPDAFNKKMLKAEDEFVAAILGLKEIFQGNRAMGVLDPDRFARQYTTSLVQTQFTQDRIDCKFIPGVRGFAATFDEEVRVKLREC